MVAESSDHSFDVTLCKHCGCSPVSMVRFKRVQVNMVELNQAGTKPGQGHIESSSCSRKSANKLAANRSTKGTASANGTVLGKFINAFFQLIYM